MLVLKVIAAAAVGNVLGWICLSVWVHKKKYPEKSLAIAVLNTVLTPLRLLGLGPFKLGKLNMEKMMKVISADLKLTDFGDTGFVAVYRLINSLPEFQAQTFTNIGYMVASVEYRMGLTRRLKLVNYLKLNPQVEQIAIKQPLFVFGLGRSGTTFLHRLLSLDPAVRSPRLWELTNPVPDVSLREGSSPGAWAADREVRKEFIKKRIAERNVMGDDGLEKYHEVGYDLPEECLFGLSDEIPTMFHYLFYVLTHWDLLKQQLSEDDFVRAYRWYKKILQVLVFQQQGQGQDQGERWVLKCPIHIFMIPHLAKAFPDARIVWAHRHPVPTISSLCSLLSTMRGIYFDNADLAVADKAAFGAVLKKIGQEVLTQAPKDIKASGLPCAHVLFEKLTADPIAAVKEVYQQFGLTFTADYEQILKAYLEDNHRQREATKAKLARQTGKAKATLHEHKPEDFGLTARELSEGVYGDYIKAFGITSSK